MKPTATKFTATHRYDGWAYIGVPVFVLVSLVTFTIVFFIFLPDNTSGGDFYCAPNGQPVFPWSDGSGAPPIWIWDPSQFLSVTLGFGHFTFPAAKAIDVVWDLLVGRGGQVLLVLLCYPILRRALTRSMEQHPVTFPVWSSLAFDKLSLGALGALCAAFPRPRRRSSARQPSSIPVLRLTGMIIVVTYVIAFPTWLSIMTGYQAHAVPWTQLPDQTIMVPADSLAQPELVVMDGSRVGANDYWALYATPTIFGNTTYDDTAIFKTILDYQQENEYITGLYDTFTEQWTTTNTTFADPYSADKPRFGFVRTYPDTLDNITSWISLNSRNYSLAAPTLLIALNPTILRTINGSGLPFYGWSYGNQSFEQWTVASQTSCEPGPTYQWGFSSLLLFVFLLLSIVFTVALMALNWGAYRNGRSDRLPHKTNVYRDALDLSHELREQLGSEVEQMSAEEVMAAVKAQKGAVAIELDGLPPSRKEEPKLRRGYASVSSTA